ncbi:MAG: hypothetical protein A2231_12875 [Candidatus Firestonebacteria bacterium RIFOXYA2_FULL_40_8]|nr:MAG: hypothetical protein A2231_12875 [Candidatus Firestonebacteria bacterium RIFOXYA2_FULL_40_8]
MKKIVCMLVISAALSFSAQWTITEIPTEVCNYLDETEIVSYGALKYFITAEYDSSASAYKVFLFTGNGTSWSGNPVEQLAAAEYSWGGAHNIAIGKNGNIHLAYITMKDLGSSYEYNLKYAKWNGISWTSTTLISAASSLSDPAIAVNVTDDAAHLVYDDNSGSLKYRNNQGGSFNAPENINAYYYTPAITCDVSGNVTIGAHSSGGGFGIYRKVLGSWAEVGNIPGINYSSYMDLLTYGGLVYVPFYDYVNEDVKCGIYNGSTSSVVDVDVGESKVGYYLKGAIDSKGVVHLAYADSSFDDLKYAKSTSSGGWTVQVLDSTGKVGYASAICIGQSDSIHIIYNDQTNMRAKYAYASSTSTVTTGTNIPPDVTLINTLVKPLSNENVEVKVDVNSSGNLKISLYSIQSKLIKVLVDETKDIGRYSYYWNGTNTGGETISSGLYLVIIENGGVRLTKKVVVVK